VLIVQMTQFSIQRIFIVQQRYADVESTEDTNSVRLQRKPVCSKGWHGGEIIKKPPSITL